jgi:hypothetical protein
MTLSYFLIVSYWARFVKICVLLLHRVLLLGTHRIKHFMVYIVNWDYTDLGENATFCYHSVFFVFTIFCFNTPHLSKLPGNEEKLWNTSPTLQMLSAPLYAPWISPWYTKDRFTEHTKDCFTEHTKDRFTEHTKDRFTEHTKDWFTGHTLVYSVKRSLVRSVNQSLVYPVKRDWECSVNQSCSALWRSSKPYL